HCLHRLNAHLLVSPLPPKEAAEALADLDISELNRSVKRINLAAMRVRVLQNPHDHTGLVLRRNRSVSTGAEWDLQHSGANHRCKVEQPFGKVGCRLQNAGADRITEVCAANS